MHHPITGEVATPLTAPMVAALGELAQCHPAPHFVPNIKTAVALLNRGFIYRAVTGEQLHTKTLYYITAHGATAYRIASRAPGVKE